RTTTLTTGTRFPARQLYVFLATEDSLFKCDGQFVAKVRTSLRAGRTPRSTCCTSEEGFEQIINCIERAKVTEACSARTIAQTSMTIAIVGCSLLWVA